MRNQTVLSRRGVGGLLLLLTLCFLATLPFTAAANESAMMAEEMTIDVVDAAQWSIEYATEMATEAEVLRETLAAADLMIDEVTMAELSDGADLLALAKAQFDAGEYRLAELVADRSHDFYTYAVWTMEDQLEYLAADTSYLDELVLMIEADYVATAALYEESLDLAVDLDTVAEDFVDATALYQELLQAYAAGEVELTLELAETYDLWYAEPFGLHENMLTLVDYETNFAYSAERLLQTVPETAEAYTEALTTSTLDEDELEPFYTLDVQAALALDYADTAYANGDYFVTYGLGIMAQTMLEEGADELFWLEELLAYNDCICADEDLADWVDWSEEDLEMLRSLELDDDLSADVMLELLYALLADAELSLAVMQAAEGS